MDTRVSLSLAGLVAAVAFAATWLVTPVVRVAAIRLRLLDLPNERSSHRLATPRGGGLAIALVVGGSLVATSGLWSRSGGLSLLLAAFLLTAVGLLDDRYGISPATRFLAQVVAAAVVVGALGSFESVPLPSPLDLPLGPLAVPLTMLWLAAVANFYNFMDGIDGLAGVQGVVTGLTIAVAGWDPLASLLGAAIAGGCAGFLRYNWSPAQIFMGDAGSIPIGLTFAALPLLAPAELRPTAALLVALSLWFFLADATWTLLRRMFRGERWYAPHRTHLYQALVDRGVGHARVAASLGLGAAALSLLGLLAYRNSSEAWAWTGLAIALALFGVEWRLARGKGDRWALA